ncbi:ATP-binding protein [Cronbergia sp. UHCC 0137]|uniref:ATP-binding protein n=1 Tax=Cronbergia sp. UHCC 0137 TaxID=3110239 RepID=UPI002B1F2BA0|nr:ATP-binding protein [Cronbergia sp. UHCC 0137]MEA5619029.1 ATP-binding protein [Cronbergia sp. UHCC 0137]
MKSLTVLGTLDSLSAIAQFVMEAATSADLNKKAAYKLRLAVDEIATNIITHGYDEAGLTGELALSAEINESNLTISIEDTGHEYDPTKKVSVEEEEFNKSLEDRQMGGLGVFLALEGVDQYLYERVGDRNRNIFIVNCK